VTYHDVPGVAECDLCGNMSVIPLAAWGNPSHWARCRCGGQVWWTPNDPPDDDGRELVPV
jgi:hypothetical protein